MNVNTILSDVLSGARMTEEDAAFLFSLKGRDVWKVADAADELRERKVGDAVTYVRNMNIHLTNICWRVRRGSRCCMHCLSAAVQSSLLYIAKTPC